ncbi:ATP-binding protein [Ihubacter massiliensis]|uniref:ATP-binding protein n=1 Tax=Hominibacterium faecale TaxID=2839743 RepID=A0A9J6QXA0_9FIRM|nr:MULTISPECIES: ATP-binding protein [Eubacteriales Family XIII. Incertae Sedis]MCO7122224.1 ATP-binding protein [Ihubacter massiliensis]MCU7380113.1 ATP-binding protein [Hominibacterium faecale]
MYSKPKVMEHFSTAHTSFLVDFEFTNNITILTGDSGTGKSAVFSFMQEDMIEEPRLLCMNYLDINKDIASMIKEAEGKLIVIDNADLLLDNDLRKYIAFDEKNQYLIIGRNPNNLMATQENLFELASEKKGERTEFRLKRYL